MNSTTQRQQWQQKEQQQQRPQEARRHDEKEQPRCCARVFVLGDASRQRGPAGVPWRGSGRATRCSTATRMHRGTSTARRTAHRNRTAPAIQGRRYRLPPSQSRPSSPTRSRGRGPSLPSRSLWRAREERERRREKSSTRRKAKNSTDGESRASRAPARP